MWPTNVKFDWPLAKIGLKMFNAQSLFFTPDKPLIKQTEQSAHNISIVVLCMCLYSASSIILYYPNVFVPLASQKCSDE